MAALNDALKARGLVTWFDSDRLIGHVQQTMASDVENTECVVVFITATYRDKINGTDLGDNCLFEFNHAVQQSGPQKMVPVVMEAGMRNPRDWKGILGANLGTFLHVDMSGVKEGTPAFDAKVREIHERVAAIVPSAKEEMERFAAEAKAKESAEAALANFKGTSKAERGLTESKAKSGNTTSKAENEADALAKAGKERAIQGDLLSYEFNLPRFLGLSFFQDFFGLTVTSSL